MATEFGYTPLTLLPLFLLPLDGTLVLLSLSPQTTLLSRNDLIQERRRLNWSPFLGYLHYNDQGKKDSFQR